MAKTFNLFLPTQGVFPSTNVRMSLLLIAITYHSQQRTAFRHGSNAAANGDEDHDGSGSHEDVETSPVLSHPQIVHPCPHLTLKPEKEGQAEHEDC